MSLLTKIKNGIDSLLTSERDKAKCHEWLQQRNFDSLNDFITTQICLINEEAEEYERPSQGEVLLESPESIALLSLSSLITCYSGTSLGSLADDE